MFPDNMPGPATPVEPIGPVGPVGPPEGPVGPVGPTIGPTFCQVRPCQI
jgi:hypothetical protein